MKLGDSESANNNSAGARSELTRRQFLSYVLGGTGAFMGALIVAPMVVSAFDPIKRSAGGKFSQTNWRISDFNDNLPTPVTFKEHVDDGWNSNDVPNDVYVIKHQQKLMIMSHVCTHLGCHVDGSVKNGKAIAPEYQGGNWFHCPCHGSLYNVYGVPTPTSPAPRPLDLYTYRIVDGKVEVGQTVQRPSNADWEYNPNPTVE